MSVRVNEFNVDAILGLFLPYHESPHFVKMLSILHLVGPLRRKYLIVLMHFRQNSSFSFLLPFKSAAKSLTRSALIKAMVSNTDVAHFVTNL